MRDGTQDGESSRVFLLRVWLDGRWRGRLQDLFSGEAQSFAGWDELLAALAAALPPLREPEIQRRARKQDDTPFSV